MKNGTLSFVKGWEEAALDVDDVYVLDDELIVFGEPREDSNHNCDLMGCNSVSHILVRCRIPDAQAKQLKINLSTEQGAAKKGDDSIDKIKALWRMEKEHAVKYQKRSQSSEYWDGRRDEAGWIADQIEKIFLDEEKT